MRVNAPGWDLPKPRRAARTLRILFALTFSALGYLAVRASKFPESPPARSTTWLRGAYHVHTVASDGRGTLADVARAAKAAELDFVILTDHNPSELAAPVRDGEALIISAAEYSTPNGHLVVLGGERALTTAERQTDAIAHARAVGGHPVIAHPIQKKEPWTDWAAATGAEGLELYSADSLYRAALRRPGTLFSALGAYLGSPERALLGLATDVPNERAKLLQLATAHPIAALCSVDAHGTPSYTHVFRTLEMYLPRFGESDPRLAADRIVAGLSSGQGVCVFRPLGEPDGFLIEGAGARPARTGDVLRVTRPAGRASTLRVSGPATLMPDGEHVRFDGPGAVQLEVWTTIPGWWWGTAEAPWIITRPITVVSGPGP